MSELLDMQYVSHTSQLLLVLFWFGFETGFGTTCDRVNNDRFFSSMLTIPLTADTTVFRAVNQYIRRISEGSCNIEDWSNDAENSALIAGINDILKYIQIEKLF